jgi:hypothetical protein
MGGKLFWPFLSRISEANFLKQIKGKNSYLTKLSTGLKNVKV